eukprot:scaffold731_cov328-Prasinococcus_capsulatus_cf.AAC.7
MATRSSTCKLGCPLHGLAFASPPGPGSSDAAAAPACTILVGGGGGAGKHGVFNKLMAAEWDAQEASVTQAAILSTGDQPAYRLAFHPGDARLVCAFAGGLRIFDVRSCARTHRADAVADDDGRA